MHAPNCEVVEVIVGQNHTANQDSYDATHSEELSHHIAQNSKDIGEGDLSDFVFYKEAAFLEDIWTQQGSEDPDYDRDKNGAEKTAKDCLENFTRRHVRADLIEQTTWVKDYLPTTLKRMMATASLTKPSPKMMENSLGNSLALRRVREATLSEADMVALDLTIRLV